jgi:hypothetical protein
MAAKHQQAGTDFGHGEIIAEKRQQEKRTQPRVSEEPPVTLGQPEYD